MQTLAHWNIERGVRSFGKVKDHVSFTYIVDSAYLYREKVVWVNSGSLKVTMVFKSKISPEKRALAILLRKESGLSFPKIAEKCKISTSSAERICKGGFCQSRQKQITSKKTGWPRKISPCVARMLQRNLLKMRNEGFAVTVKKLVEYSGLSLQTASVRTYSRYLNDMGFFFLQARKKGLLRENNKKLRLCLQRECTLLGKRNCLLSGWCIFHSQV